MAFIVPTIWSETTSYITGQQVLRDGVVYEATTTITLGTDPKVSNDWVVIAVNEIVDYNSLVEAIRLNINVNNVEVNRSVPLFIQLAEESFKTRIRAPQQRKRTILTVDSQGRVEVPGDLLEVINLRSNSDEAAGAFRDVRSRGVIEILIGNYEDYQKLLRFNQSDNFVGINDYNAFDAPIYWFDAQYFWIAPLYDVGTEIELIYYATIPQLGSVVNLTDADGNPVDVNGMLTSASNLPQAQQVVTQNWFTAAAPQMLLYGAIMKAEAYLEDPEKAAIFKEAFEVAQSETQDMINRFEINQAHTIYLENTYSSRI